MDQITSQTPSLRKNPFMKDKLNATTNDHAQNGAEP